MSEPLPGPWLARGVHVRTACEDDYTVANCWSGPKAPTREIACKNAMLIAAAPDLLAACETALHALGIAQDDVINMGGPTSEEALILDEPMIKIRAAIAKAKKGKPS